MDLQEIYYYVRDDRRRPIITVCLLVEGGQAIAKGVAVCSQLDNPSKQIGRSIAKGRAVKVLNYHAERYDYFTCQKAFEVLNLGVWPDIIPGRTKATNKPSLRISEENILAKLKKGKPPIRK